MNIVMDPKPASANVVVTPAGAFTGLALSVTEQPAGTVVWSTIDDTTGTVTVTGLVPGRTYRFAATSTNYQKPPVDVPIVPGSNAVNIVMDLKLASASITLGGSVASATGFVLSISPSTGVTGPTGAGPYAFTGLTPNTNYTFQVVANGYITFTSGTFSAAPGGTITQTFTPVPFVSFTDTVANGTAGDDVYLCAPTGQCNAATHLQTVALTAASNSFTFTGLDAGSYRVRAVRDANTNDTATLTVAANTGAISPAALGLTL